MTGACTHEHGEITEALLLRIPLPERLIRQIAHCAVCADEACEAREVVATFDHADTGHGAAGERAGAGAAAAASSASASTSQRVGPAGRTGSPALSGPRVARVRLAAVAAAVAVAVAGFGLGPMVQGDGTGATTSVALTRTGLMVPHPWGTEIPVTISGLPVDRTFRLMTVDAAGTAMPGGSVRAGAAAPVHAEMVTAMHRDAIVALRVEDEHGNRIAEMQVNQT